MDLILVEIQSALTIFFIYFTIIIIENWQFNLEDSQKNLFDARIIKY